jgi:uncharacterized protein
LFEGDATGNNDVRYKKPPGAFNGFTLLHMSDYLADVSDGAMCKLEEILSGLSYDLCVIGAT